MARVWIRKIRNGRERRVPERQAALLTRLGTWEYVGQREPLNLAPIPAEAPVAPKAASYADMDYHALRSLAAARGVEPASRKRVDVIAALEASDTP